MDKKLPYNFETKVRSPRWRPFGMLRTHSWFRAGTGRHTLRDWPPKTRQLTRHGVQTLTQYGDTKVEKIFLVSTAPLKPCSCPA